MEFLEGVGFYSFPVDILGVTNPMKIYTWYWNKWRQ